MTVVALLASVTVLVALPIGSAQGAAFLDSGFAQKKVVGGLTRPMDMEFAPDGRLFITTKEGKVHVVKRGGKLATFSDISARVATFGERGLQALTFDPN